MSYPEFTMKARFFRARYAHLFAHSEFGHTGPHTAICGAEGNLHANWHSFSTHTMMCPQCEAIENLNARLAAGNPPPISWKRPYNSNVAHAVLDWDAQPTDVPLCSTKVNSYVPGQGDEFSHCKTCESIISAAQPSEGTTNE